MELLDVAGSGTSGITFLVEGDLLSLRVRIERVIAVQLSVIRRLGIYRRRAFRGVAAYHLSILNIKVRIITDILSY